MFDSDAQSVFTATEMRSMASGAAFHRAYLHATQQAFLEAHEYAFDYFGGVFHLLRQWIKSDGKVRPIFPTGCRFGGPIHPTRRTQASGSDHYDNLASAVRKILRRHRREETVRFMAFRSHWRFAAEFRTPGEGHEKGGVEAEGGYFRRNHLVPAPSVTDLEALLAAGDYVARAEPILLVGAAGTGKTHLATGLCVAAWRRRRRGRSTNWPRLRRPTN